MAQKKSAAKEKAVRFGFQYAVKVLCTANVPGTSQTTTSLVPGVYETSVNIHNPNKQTVAYRMKLAVPGLGPSQFVSDKLGPDEAARPDCPRIVKDFGITFIHGAECFLVIESAQPFDVVAVYTACKRGGEVESIDVEQIRERRLV
jgi:hypothetical protein